MQVREAEQRNKQDQVRRDELNARTSNQVGLRHLRSIVCLLKIAIISIVRLCKVKSISGISEPG